MIFGFIRREIVSEILILYIRFMFNWSQKWQKVKLKKLYRFGGVEKIINWHIFYVGSHWVSAFS